MVGIAEEQRGVDNYSWNPLRIAPEATRIATLTALREACEKGNEDVVVQDKDDFYTLEGARATWSPPEGLANRPGHQYITHR